MSRLIDADALLYNLEIVPLTGDGGVDVNELDDIIKRQPTIEITQEDVEAYCKSRCLVVMTAELFECLKRGLPSAEPKPQWIPCSRKLPDKGLRVLMQLNNAWQIVGWYDKEDKQWFELMYEEPVANDRVLAWMPLPKYEDIDG